MRKVRSAAIETSTCVASPGYLQIVDISADFVTLRANVVEPITHQACSFLLGGHVMKRGSGLPHEIIAQICEMGMEQKFEWIMKDDKGHQSWIQNVHPNSAELKRILIPGAQEILRSLNSRHVL